MRNGATPRGRVAGALQRFLAIESSSGILLLVATAAALGWANLAEGSYEGTWTVRLTLGSGEQAITNDLRHWINEGAMALFFYVVGLEIKRELVMGELRDRRAAALPVFAALGGMVVPALIYIAVAGAAGRGWGIPMATDIAFAVGVLAVVGKHAPSGLKLFLLTLAIVDDVGAIVLIAVAFSDAVSIGTLAAAAALLVVFASIQRVAPRLFPLQILVAIAVWVAVHEAGVHATIAGIALALVTPAESTARLEQGFHPWTSYLIVPLFALANAGVVLTGNAFDGSASVRVAVGVALGLMLGKIIGITVGAAVATRLRFARLPAGVGWRHVVGAAALGGIGFTVSLFIAGLAFPSGKLLAAAKAGILAGSAAACLIGAALLWVRPGGERMRTPGSGDHRVAG